MAQPVATGEGAPPGTGVPPLSRIERKRLRRVNEILRVPGAAIPGVLAPTIFFLGLSAVFGNLTLLPGFTTDTYQSFIIPVSLMQGAAFTATATSRVQTPASPVESSATTSSMVGRCSGSFASVHGALLVEDASASSKVTPAAFWALR